MSRYVTIKGKDGDFKAYVADGTKHGPAILVIQEIFGVNHFVREVADRYAAEGYTAIAPDLFWRIEPGIDITDKTDADGRKPSPTSRRSTSTKASKTSALPSPGRAPKGTNRSAQSASALAVFLRTSRARARMQMRWLDTTAWASTTAKSGSMDRSCRASTARPSR